MGRGTKHKADWKEATLQVVVDARRLYCHSVKIMGNEKVFNPKNDFQNSTLIKIQESLLSVYTRVWDANRINVSKFPDLAGEIKDRLSENLAKVGLSLHPTKTRIRSAKDGVTFLGFLFRVTESGKVLMLRDPQRVKEIRRRLRRLAHKIRRGDAEAETLDESYRCVRACMEKGNSRRLLRRMDDFVEQLKKGN